MRHGWAQLVEACNVAASLSFCMSCCATLDNSAMSPTKADLDVQWCSLIIFSAFELSRRLHACSAAAMSILSCLVLKPHLLPACCMCVAGCMLTLCDCPEQAQGRARGPSPCSACPNSQAVSSPGLPLGFLQCAAMFRHVFIRIHLSYVFFA